MSERKKSVWAPVVPVPDDAPAPILRHPERGEPDAVFPYENADGQLMGYTRRFLTSTGEPIYLPLTWCRDQDGVHAWRTIQFERLRPLYNLPELASADEVDNVLICFDERSVRWAKRLVPWLVPMSWPGGTRKIDESDWSVLKGRAVWVWPTLSRQRQRQRQDVVAGEGFVLPRDRQPMWQAALKIERIVTGFGGQVISIIDPWSDPDRPEGFDLGMAGMQDWTPERAQDWMMAHLSRGVGTDIQQRLRRLKGEEAAPVAADASSTPSAAGAGEQQKGEAWIPDLVYLNGKLSSCLSNVIQILSHQPEWKGVFGLDQFALKIMKLKPPPYPNGVAGEWTDIDDTLTTALLQRQYHITPSSLLIREAVMAVADANKYHPVLDWEKTKVWDGTCRLDHWAIDLLGVEDTPYTRRVSRWWMMGVAKRILRPGCKFDYVLVLEGSQGKRKSTVFDVLGGDWFGDNELDFGNKDSMIALQGKMIYEIPELGALARSDERRQKAFLSRRIDEFRPPFGRGFVKMPRSLVFGGTTNEWEWNKDPTGGRRFWPLAVGESIDIEGLIAIRDQLFAEAFHRVRQDERCWPTEEEQRKLFDPEQLRIEQPDAYVDALHDWVYSRTGDFSLAESAMDGLKLDAGKLTRDVQTRIGTALRKLGCTRFEKRNGMTRFWYKPPVRSGQVHDAAATGAYGDDHVGF